MSFTPEQQAEVDRFVSIIDRELTLEKLEKRTPAELRAKVNILTISDTVTFAPENNYTAQEIAYIEAAMPVSKWATEIPKLLAKVAALEAEGLSPAAVVELVKK